jgi:WD40 repeat protein
VYVSLAPEHAEVARHILLRLVTPGEGAQDTRRPVSRAELDFAPERDVDAVLDRLVAARLLTLDDKTVDLAHEALITAWPRLSAWIDEARERLLVHRRLTEAARAWDELGREPGALYRGTRLAAASEQLAEASLTPLERGFLTASRAASTSAVRRRRGVLAAVAVLVVLALVAGVAAWQQSLTSERRHVEAEARSVAAVADAMRFSDPVQAMRLSLAAFELADTTETRSALLGAVTQKELDVFSVPDAGGGPAVHRLTADGRTLVTITPRRIVTWDVPTQRRTHTYRGIGQPRKDDDLEDSTRMSPDGRTLALLEQDRVRLWDVRAGRVTEEIAVRGWPLEVVFGSDGGTLVVAGLDIEAWDLRRGRQLLRVPISQDYNGHAMVVSADNKLLAVCGDVLRIWDMVERRRLRLPRAAEAASSSCRPDAFAFNPANDHLTLATDTGIRTWALDSGEELPELETGSVEMLRFSADGAFVAVTRNDEIQLWRAPTRQEDRTPDDPVFRYPLLSESSYELRVDIAQGVLRYGSWTGTTVRSLDVSEAVTGQWQANLASKASWSEGGRALAVVRDTGERWRFQLLHGRTGRVVSELPGAPCPGFGVCTEVMSFSPDGRYLAYGAVWSDLGPKAPPQQRITVWDVVNRRRQASLVFPQVKEDGSEPGISGAALSADGRTLALARTLPDSLELWDVRRGRLLRTVPRFVGPQDNNNELAINSDGSKVVSPAHSVADPRSGQANLLPLGDEQTAKVTFSRDGRYLAAGDLRGRVTIWDGNLRQRLGVLAGANTGERHGYSESVTSLAFSPDSSLLAVGGNYGTIQIWDTASNRTVGSALPSPGDQVLALAFSKDGSTLRIASPHVFPREQDLNWAHLVKQACARARGGLSPARWETYLPDVPYRKTC